MKKLIATVLVLMLALSLCACGSSGATSPEAGSNTGATAEVDKTGVYSIEEKLEQPIVLLDDEYVTVTAIAKLEWRYSIAANYRDIGYVVLLENKTDKDIVAYGLNLCGNGFMVDDYQEICEVPAGMKANGWLTMSIDADSSVAPFYTFEELESFEGDFALSVDGGFREEVGHFSVSY